jgi:hypothetical protein
LVDQIGQVVEGGHRPGVEARQGEHEGVADRHRHGEGLELRLRPPPSCQEDGWLWSHHSPDGIGYEQAGSADFGCAAQERLEAGGLAVEEESNQKIGRGEEGRLFGKVARRSHQGEDGVTGAPQSATQQIDERGGVAVAEEEDTLCARDELSGIVELSLVHL